MAEPSSSRLSDLQERWQQDPTSRIYLQLADEYRKLDRHPEAVDVLKKGLQSRPNDISGLVSLGRCHLELGELEPAIAALENVIQRDPTHMVGNKLLIEARIQSGDAAEAGERFELYKLLNGSDPDLPRLERQLQSLRAHPHSGPPPAPAAPAAPASDFDDGLPPLDELPDLDLPDDSTASAEEVELAYDSEPDFGELPEDLPSLDATAATDATDAGEPAFELAPEEDEAPAFDEEPVFEPSSGAEYSFEMEDEEAPALAADEVSFESEPESASFDFEETATPLETPEPEDLLCEEPTLQEPVLQEPVLQEPVLQEPVLQEPALEAEAVEPQTFELEEIEEPEPVSEDLFQLGPPPPAPALEELWGFIAAPPVSEAVEPEPEAAPPEEPPITATLGDLYLRQGHTEEAERIFHKVLAKDPANEAALLGLEKIRTATAEQEEVTAPIAYVTVEPKTVEPKTVEPKTVEPETVEPEQMELEDVDEDVDEAVEPEAVEPEAVENATPSPVATPPETPRRLTAQDLLARAGGQPPAGLTAKKAAVLDGYLNHLRNAGQTHVH